MPTTRAFRTVTPPGLYQRESIKFLMFGHVQVTTRVFPSSAGLPRMSSLCTQTPIIGMFSSLAHFISQHAPSPFGVFLLIKAITPSQPLILLRQFVFHCESQGSFTD